MKVILLKDIKSLGKKGDLVEVSDGYARNYLLPKGLAVLASEGNIKKAKEEKKAQAKRKEKERQEAQELAQKLSNTTIIIKVKASDEGRLYGSVTSKDIAQELENQAKIKVDKRKINLSEPIRYIGNIDVDIKVYPQITATFKVKVEPEE
ncbi:MAG TPA: 50S ribosomal protein L9 [Eubacteriaceae bacterium]|nr:50S ribosomal protein L9 [Eubacteriaceae bacterium]